MSTEPIENLNDWKPGDFSTLAETAALLQCSPADLLLVMRFESQLSPKAQAPGKSGAVGLIQITNMCNKAMGMTEADRLAIKTMSVHDQLTSIVPKYFQTCVPWTIQGKPYKSATHVWLAIIAPGFAGSYNDPNQVIYKDDGNPQGAYRQNSGLDQDNKGTITVNDLTRALGRVVKGSLYQGALARLNMETGKTYMPTLPGVIVTPPSPLLLVPYPGTRPRSAGRAGLFLVGAALVAGVFFLRR